MIVVVAAAAAATAAAKAVVGTVSVIMGFEKITEESEPVDLVVVAAAVVAQTFFGWFVEVGAFPMSYWNLVPRILHNSNKDIMSKIY